MTSVLADLGPLEPLEPMDAGTEPSSTAAKQPWNTAFNPDSIFRADSQPVEQEDINAYVRLIPNFVSKHVREYCETIARQVEERMALPLSMISVHDSSVTPNAVSMEDISSRLKPVALEGFAAVAMCDVSGYSSLTSYLASRGTDGAELMSLIMKEYLDKIIHIISLHGGDIVKFVGDAVIFYWKYQEPAASFADGVRAQVLRSRPQADERQVKEAVEKALMQRKGAIVIKAASCCLDLLEKLRNYKIRLPPPRKADGAENGEVEERELKIHLGIGAGKIYDIHVGGAPGRWEHLVVGDAMEQIAQVLDLAKPDEMLISTTGQLALSKKAFEYFKQCVSLSKVYLESYDTKKGYILNGMDKNATCMIAEDLAGDNDFLALWEIGQPRDPPRNIIEYYKQYINQSALFKLESDLRSANPFQMNQGVNHLMSLNELRQVTTVFLKIGSLSFQAVDNYEDALKEQKRYIAEQEQTLKTLQSEYERLRQLEQNMPADSAETASAQYAAQQVEANVEAASAKLDSSKAVQRDLEITCALELEEAVRKCQAALTSVQTVLKKHEGILRQFHVDDKGAVILAFFGLPPLAHKNDAKLGVQAGLELCEELSKHFDLFSIGITTGVVSIGGVGNSLRTEYALMAESINTAARLMSLKEATNSAICDERTHSLSANEFEYEELGQKVIKGKPLPISIFRPVKAKEAPKMSYQGEFSMIGRVREREVAKLVLERHSRRGESDCVITVEGEGGQGTTTFGRYIQHLAGSNEYSLCMGSASESMHNTPYYIYRTVVRDLIAVLESADAADDGVLRVGEPLMNPLSNSRPSFRRGSANMPSSLSRHSLHKSMASIELKPVKRQSFGMRAVLRSQASIAPAHISQAPGSLPPSQVLLSPGRSFLEPGGAQKDQRISEFEHAVKRSMLKTGQPTQLSYLLALILPTEFRNDELKHHGQIQTRQQELANVLKGLLNSLANGNRVMVHFSEANFMDAQSWELTRELVEGCPRVMFVILSRPLRHFASAATAGQKIYSEIRAKSTVLELNGLTDVELHSFIVASWNGNAEDQSDTASLAGQQSIKSVDHSIVQRVHAISGGNPLFAQTLVMTLKERKLYDVLANGMLVLTGDFDFDRIAPGSDLHSIIVSQFDRLDPMFQTFLKMGSVMGTRFFLDEAIEFLQYETVEGNGNIKVPVRSALELLDAVERHDKFAFLVISRPEAKEGEQTVRKSHTRLDDESDCNSDSGYGYALSFKNSIIRESIYSTMLASQRQAMHLSMAKFFEDRLDPDFPNAQLLLKIFEHYQRTEGQIDQKLKYLSQVCRHYFQMSAMKEAVRHYEDLLNLVDIRERQVSHMSTAQLAAKYIPQFSDAEKAVWHMEMGDAYIVLSNYDKAERCLRKALLLLNYRLPQHRMLIPVHSLKEYWRFKRSMVANRAVPDMASLAQYRLDNIRQVLLSLADLYDYTDMPDMWAYTLWLGMNVSDHLPRNSRYASYLAACSYALFIVKNQPDLALKYIVRAEDIAIKSSYFENNDFVTVGTFRACLQLLTGDLGEARNYCLRVLGQPDEVAMVADFHHAERCGRLLMFVELFDGRHKECKAIANELWIRSKDRSWNGRFWSLAFIFMLDVNLLDVARKGADSAITPYLSDLRRRIHNLVDEQAWSCQRLTTTLIYETVLLEAEFWMRSESTAEPGTRLMQMTAHLRRASAFHWPCLLAICAVFNIIFAAYDTHSLHVLGSHTVILNYLKQTIVSLQRMGQIVYSSHLQQLARGLSSLLQHRASEAVRIWRSEHTRIQESKVAKDSWTAQVLTAKAAKYSDSKKLV
ncbi:hypothetical protein RI367_001522 [Sorochytrium milnesiophthora]